MSQTYSEVALNLQAVLSQLVSLLQIQTRQSRQASHWLRVETDKWLPLEPPRLFAFVSCRLWSFVFDTHTHQDQNAFLFPAMTKVALVCCWRAMLTNCPMSLPMLGCEQIVSHTLTSLHACLHGSVILWSM